MEMGEMILTVDIGNTNIAIGCGDGEQILFRERVSTNRSATDLEYAAALKMAFDVHGFDKDSIDGAIISSVVPSVTFSVKRAVEKYLNVKAKLVGPGIKTGLSIEIDDPAQLGSDLVAEAVAGAKLYPTPLIIVDMGTATTFSVIGEGGKFLGSMIVPGLAVSHDSLISHAALLSTIAFENPKRVIGRNSSESLKSGLLYGNAGAIDGLIDRACEELKQDCTVVATGSLVNEVIPLCRHKIIIDDDLLLCGLMLIYNKNKS